MKSKRFSSVAHVEQKLAKEHSQWVTFCLPALQGAENFPNGGVGLCVFGSGSVAYGKMGDWQQNPHQTKWTKYDWWSYIILQFLFHFGGYTVDANDYLQKQPGCVETRLLVLSNKKRWFQALLVVLNPCLWVHQTNSCDSGNRKGCIVGLLRHPQRPELWCLQSLQDFGVWFRRVWFRKKVFPAAFWNAVVFLLIWFYQTWGCVQICATLFKSALMWYPSGICMIFWGWWVPGIFKLEVFNRDPHN